MKNLRILIFVLLTFAFMLLLTGCAEVCNPSEQTWDFVCYTKDAEFIGGVTRSVSYDGSDLMFPFATPEECNITFYDDGKVSFKTCDGEQLEGIFSYEHKKKGGTDFTIEFNNGEIANGNCINIFMGGAELTLTFRDVKYSFNTNRGKIYNLSKSDFISRVRGETYSDLIDATITKDEEGYIVDWGDGGYLITPETAVYAMLLDESNTFTVLDEIQEGECRIMYLDKKDIITLYYVEPRKMLLSEANEWITTIEISEITQIELTDNIWATGENKERIITDTLEIGSIMDMLKSITITEPSENLPSVLNASIEIDIRIRTMDGKIKDLTVYVVEENLYIHSPRDYWHHWEISDCPRVSDWQ